MCHINDLMLCHMCECVRMCAACSHLRGSDVGEMCAEVGKFSCRFTLMKGFLKCHGRKWFSSVLAGFFLRRPLHWHGNSSEGLQELWLLLCGGCWPTAWDCFHVQAMSKHSWGYPPQFEGKKIKCPTSSVEVRKFKIGTSAAQRFAWPRANAPAAWRIHGPLPAPIMEAALLLAAPSQRCPTAMEKTPQPP